MMSFKDLKNKISFTTIDLIKLGGLRSMGVGEGGRGWANSSSQKTERASAPQKRLVSG